MTFTNLTFGENDESVLFVRDDGKSGVYPQPTPGRLVEEELEYTTLVGPISPFVPETPPTAQQRVDDFRAAATVLKAAIEVVGIQAGLADEDAVWDAVRDALP